MPSTFKISDVLYVDASSITLLLTNIFTIAIAIWQGWSSGEVIVLYFIQSIIIGFYQFFKIIDLKNFSTKGVSFNGMPAPETPYIKYFFAITFVFHYGVFHFVYLIFLFVFLNIGSVSLSLTPLFILSILLIFSNHTVSYFLNRKKDSERNVNIGKMFLLPYGRIIPMHVIIILMGFLTVIRGDSLLILVIFMALKTIGDLISHNAEHNLYKE